MAGENITDDLERDAYVNPILVGPCPRCGSFNTHDCEKRTFDVACFPEREEIKVGGIPLAKGIAKTGSNCPATAKIDDNTVGHCDDCDYLWCIECGAELSIDQPKCDHWKICEQCGRSYETPSTCPHFEEEQAGDLMVNPCLLGCPRIETCSKCPYNGQTEDCPKVKKK